jgi:hypothetical protein
MCKPLIGAATSYHLVVGLDRDNVLGTDREEVVVKVTPESTRLDHYVLVLSINTEALCRTTGGLTGLARKSSVKFYYCMLRSAECVYALAHLAHA